ncbi:MAG: hypothetical protein ACO3A2_10485 [Bdellovibrionia bacterium]
MKRAWITTCVLWCFVTFFATGDEAMAEIVLGPVSTQLIGPRASEALQEALGLENITQILEGFIPSTQQMEFIRHPIRNHGEDAIVHVSFKKVGHPSDSFLDLSKRYLSSGELVGRVTRLDLVSCHQENAHGYRLNVDLSQSSYLILSQITQVSIEVCFSDLTPLGFLGTQMSFLFGFEPGVLFPGMEDPRVKGFIQEKLEQWMEAIVEKAQHHQSQTFQPKASD